MSAILERAKAIQAKTAADTNVWIRLDLLEGLIAEVERLLHRCDALAQAVPAKPKNMTGVVDLASKRGREPEAEK